MRQDLFEFYCRYYSDTDFHEEIIKDIPNYDAVISQTHEALVEGNAEMIPVCVAAYYHYLEQLMGTGVL